MDRPTVTRPHRRAARSPRLGVVLAASVLFVSCAGFDARMALKNGNQLYKEGKYAKAVAAFEKVPPATNSRLRAALGTGYSYMAQYRFGSKKDIDRELAQKAVAAFNEYLSLLTPKALKDQSLPNRDKVEEWIVTLLADADQYEQAIARLEDNLKTKPNDPALLRGIASTYDKWGKPTRALEYFQKWAATFPSDASPQVAIAAYCWNMSYRMGTNMDVVERNRWVDNGLTAADAALRINPNLFEGLTYKNLLLRERAKLRIDPDQVAVLLRDANTILDQAKVIRQKQKDEEAAKAKASPSPKTGGA